MRVASLVAADGGSRRARAPGATPRCAGGGRCCRRSGRAPAAVEPARARPCPRRPIRPRRGTRAAAPSQPGATAGSARRRRAATGFAPEPTNPCTSAAATASPSAAGTTTSTSRRAAAAARAAARRRGREHALAQRVGRAERRGPQLREERRCVRTPPVCAVRRRAAAPRGARSRSLTRGHRPSSLPVVAARGSGGSSTRSG